VSSSRYAALINMADNIELARVILNETQRLSWRHIWEEEMKDRFTHVGKPEPEPENAQNAVPSAPDQLNSPPTSAKSDRRHQRSKQTPGDSGAGGIR
jgi:hypothetical protein